MTDSKIKRSDTVWRYPSIIRGVGIGLLLFLLIELVRPWASDTPLRAEPVIYYFMLLWIALGIIAEYLIPWMRKVFRPQDVAN